MQRSGDFELVEWDGDLYQRGPSESDWFNGNEILYYVLTIMLNPASEAADTEQYFIQVTDGDGCGLLRVLKQEAGVSIDPLCVP